MSYAEAFSNPKLGQKLLSAIAREADRPRDYFLMEFCGGHTHALCKNGLNQLLPPNVHMVHGPGCPVCVLPTGRINQALTLLETQKVVFCTFGDMSRVPGSRGKSFLSARAAGADVRMVLGPLQALQLAESNPECEVVFFAVGFETTAPATALALREAKRKRLTNFSVLCNHVRTLPAMFAVLEGMQAMQKGEDKPNMDSTATHEGETRLNADNTATHGGKTRPNADETATHGGKTKPRVDGMVAPGHVAVVTGALLFEEVCKTFNLPVCVAGFEVLDMLEAIYRLLRQLNREEVRVENAYARAATQAGNLVAKQLLEEVFSISPCFEWRGLGSLPKSAFCISKSHGAWDAEAKWTLPYVPVADNPRCCCAKVLQGLQKPTECTLFAKACTPDSPMGACMVSPEGACSAYFANVGGKTELSYS